VKWVNKISVLFLGIIFLLTATGIVVYQSHCSCTGDEHVSFYVSPETCEDKYHSHHTHGEGGKEIPSTGSECHECSSHTNECGCNNYLVSYFKLKNEVVHEKGRTLTKQPVKIVTPELMVVWLSFNFIEPPEIKHTYIEPPSNKSSLDFLIHINQLKIPHLA
jgi:hypothetical protein